MARRDLSDARTVINQTVDTSQSLMAGIADVGKHIIEQNQKARITENMSAAQLELSALAQQYRIDFESNPEAGVTQYKEKRKELLEKYGQDISPFFRGNWNKLSRDMQGRDDLSQQAWALQQARKNTVASVNRTIENNLKGAYAAGSQFADNDDAVIGDFLNFAAQRQNLAGFASSELGGETAQTLLKSYDQDYMKSFIAGVMEVDPIKAVNLLEDEQVVKSINDPKALNTLRKAAASEMFKMADKAAVERLTAEAVQNEDIYRKRVDGSLSWLEVEEMEASGAISKEFGASLKRGLDKPDAAMLDEMVRKGVMRHEAAERIKKATGQTAAPKIPIEEQKQVFVEYWNWFSELGVKDGNAKAHLSELIKFQQAVLSDNRLSRSDARSLKLDQVSSAIRERVDNNKFSVGWSRDPYHASLRAISGFTRMNPSYDNTDMKYEMYKSMVEAADEYDFDKIKSPRERRNAQNAIANDVIEGFLRAKNPTLAGMENLPDTFIDENGVVIRIPKSIATATGNRVDPPTRNERESYRVKNGGGVVTMEQIRQTAQEFGMTERGVVEHLRRNGIID